jgi:hypothetical protein
LDKVNPKQKNLLLKQSQQDASDRRKTYINKAKQK